jgi:hypothetical protein
MFARAFTDGFLNWEQILTTRMGLDLRPLTDSELWEDLWGQFNSTPPPPVPQLLVMTESGLVERFQSQVHMNTKLLERAESIPFADRRFVYLKGEYVGVLTFIDKPAGWSSKGKQLRYIWEALSRDGVANTNKKTMFSYTLVDSS